MPDPALRQRGWRSVYAYAICPLSLMASPSLPFLVSSALHFGSQKQELRFGILPIQPTIPAPMSQSVPETVWPYPAVKFIPHSLVVFGLPSLLFPFPYCNPFSFPLTRPIPFTRSRCSGVFACFRFYLPRLYRLRTARLIPFFVFLSGLLFLVGLENRRCTVGRVEMFSEKIRLPV